MAGLQRHECVFIKEHGTGNYKQGTVIDGESGMMDFYQYRNLEFSRPDEIRNVQERLLKNHLNYIFDHSHYYRRVLNGIALNKITLDEISRLPFTDKSVFENHNDELLSVPVSKIVDIVLSQSTAGNPPRIILT